MNRKFRKTSFFTLIEVIAVILILAILAALAVPKYFALVEKSEDAAADAVIGELNARETQAWGLSKLEGNLYQDQKLTQTEDLFTLKGMATCGAKTEAIYEVWLTQLAAPVDGTGDFTVTVHPPQGTANNLGPAFWTVAVYPTAYAP